MCSLRPGNLGVFGVPFSTACEGNCEEKCVELLLDAGATVDRPDKEGNTALDIADVNCAQLIREPGGRRSRQ